MFTKPQTHPKPQHPSESGKTVIWLELRKIEEGCCPSLSFTKLLEAGGLEATLETGGDGNLCVISNTAVSLIERERERERRESELASNVRMVF